MDLSGFGVPFLVKTGLTVAEKQALLIFEVCRENKLVYFPNNTLAMVCNCMKEVPYHLGCDLFSNPPPGISKIPLAMKSKWPTGILNLEAIKSHKGLFSARIHPQFCLSLSFEADETILLRQILDHDDMYRNP